MSFVKKITLVSSFSILALITVSFIFIADPSPLDLAQADNTDNVVGYAWNDNIGWISFNCTNHYQFCQNDLNVMCNVDNDCVNAGVGGICLSECSNSDYGVNVSSVNGKFSGYAWSSNVGWIDFSPNPPYPALPNNVATYNSSTGTVTGWAKIISQGDDGWIKLSGSWSNGVSINNLTFTGWGWNGNDGNSGIGWISFNCADSGAGGCSSSNYSVSININPVVTDLSKATFVHCEYPGPKKDVRAPLLRWTFTDENSEDIQKAYELVLSANQDYSSPLINTGKVINSSASQYDVSLSDGLNYDTIYYWRVRVWDNHNFASDWASSSFKTDKHAYPDIIDITANPTSPRALEDTLFSATAKTYGSSSVANNGWLFSSSDTIPTSVATSTYTAVDLGGGVIQSNTQGAGPVQFQTSGAGEVLLGVTDTDGYYCEKPLSVSSTISLPTWREVKPQ